MDLGYAERYRELYRRHWWWRVREEIVLRELEARTPEGGFGEILDIGCGDGLFFDPLSTLGNPQGIEPEEAAVTVDGPWAKRIEVRPFDASYRPEARFGLILMLDVLEHIEDDQGALAHARSLLAAGGLLVLTVPALAALWTRHDELNHHFRRYHRRELRALASGSGLEVEGCRYFFHWLVGAKLAVRLKESLLSPAPRTPEVPVPWVNRLCTGACRLEARLARIWSPPAGSSLLLIARDGLR